MAAAESSKESPRRTLQFQAQIRSYEQKLKSLGIYKTINHYDTPPQKITHPVNPFKDKDPEKLLRPIVSPDIFDNIISPSEIQKELGEFVWTLEDLAVVNPAKIDTPKALLDESLDETTESQVQEAIKRYFEESHNVITPQDCPGAQSLFMDRESLDSMNSPMSFPQQSSSTPRATRSRINSYSQMDISIQDSGMFYSTFNDDDSSTLFSKRNSLRRKLFQHIESPISEDENRLEIGKSTFKRSDWSPGSDEHGLQSPALSPIQQFERSEIIEMITDSPGLIDRRMSIDVHNLHS